MEFLNSFHPSSFHPYCLSYRIMSSVLEMYFLFDLLTQDHVIIFVPIKEYNATNFMTFHLLLLSSNHCLLYSSLDLSLHILNSLFLLCLCLTVCTLFRKRIVQCKKSIRKIIGEEEKLRNQKTEHSTTIALLSHTTFTVSFSFSREKESK